jgi:hypothetical protein
MKWFDRWFARKSKWVWDNRDELADELVSTSVPSRKLSVVDADSSWGDGLRMNVKKIIGGYVVSFRAYDRIRDRSDERHYIITDEQDFNQELGKMITMESMRQTNG